jgi:hypothetical protein
MIGKILVRTLGFALICWALFLLSKLANPEVRAAIISMPTFVSRYLGMLTAGLGFVLLRRWGLYVYIAFAILQWVVFFTVYGGHSAQGPLWLGLVGPMTVVALAALNWKHLR